MSPEELAQILKEANRALHLGATSADVDEWVQQQTGLPSLKGLLQAVNQQQTQADLAPGTVGGLLRSGVKGATFGFNDELAGLFDAAIGGDYTTARDAERGADASFRESDPKKAFASEMLGGLLPALMTGGTSQAATFGQLAKTGAAYGAGAGALYGAGNAEELADVPADAALGGVIGAPLGYVAGAASKPIGDLLGGLGRGLRRVFAPQADVNAAVQGTMARFIPPDARAQMSVAEQLRPGEAVLGDMAPGLLDVAGSVRPDIGREAADVLATRNAGAGTRMIEDLTEVAVGPSRGAPRFVDAKEAQAYAQSQLRPTARKLYGPLEEMYPEVAIEAGEDISRVGQALAYPEVRAVYQSLAPMAEHLPSFRLLQATLQKMKAKATNLFATAGGGDEAVRMANGARVLEDAMEADLPGFRAANLGYATTKETVQAFEDGAQAYLRDPRDISAALAKLGPDAQSAYRMAALDRYTQRLRDLSPEGNAFREGLRRGSQTLEPHLKALFGSTREMDRFLASSEVEQMFRRAFDATRAGSGSKTANRTEISAAMFGKEEGLPASTLAFFRNMGKEGRDERIAEGVGRRMLTRSGSPELQRVLGEIDAFRQQMMQSDQTRVQAARLLGTGAGVTGSRLRQDRR